MYTACIFPGQFNSDIEVIIGTCKDEGLSDFADAWLDPDFFETIRSTFDTAGTARILGLMRYSEVTPEDVEKARKIIDAYVGGVENITSSNIQNLIDMMTDSSMLYGAHKKIGYLLDQGVTVYQYMLTHRGQYSIAELKFSLLDGIPLTVNKDIQYVFSLLNITQSNSTGWPTQTT